MGVKIKMVTGDALAIACETAKALGMGTNILDGAILGDSKTKETAEITKSIEQADGFAQVFPEHKFHIVDVLQQHGHIVGMTGDGVNDAPALKKADCGFAVSGATDAARAAASIVLVAPGLSVIIDAIKESRKIFQRMNSYAIYRIAETLRVLLFMTLAIVIFNFYPLTAIMIVMLALLNDGAILSIAYDKVTYRNQPEAWNMRTVLGIATVLGLVGPIAAFGLFYLGNGVFHVGHPQLQTMMYLMLSVAGHLTIFQTRTRGPWWSTRPAWILLAAVFGTQAIATLIAVYGVSLVTPLGWKYAGIVWVYAFAWFLVTDPIKLLAYKVLDSVKTPAKAGTKASSREGARAMPNPKAASTADSPAKPETKAAANPVAASPPKPEAAEPPPPQAAEGESVPKSAADDAAKPATRTDQKPDLKAAPGRETKPEPSAEAGAAVDKLVNTTLGDILLAGVLKDPESAGRIVAEAISHAEAPGAAADASDTAAASDAKTKASPKADAKAKPPSPATPETAK